MAIPPAQQMARMPLSQAVVLAIIGFAAELLSLPTTAVPVTVAEMPVETVVQLEVPQAKPVGQQPPPTLAGQLDQPVAQESEVAVVLVLSVTMPVLTGTTTVTPSEIIVEEEEAGGQDVLLQSRPIRQHPEMPG
jgi:hypothetical protein